MSGRADTGPLAAAIKRLAAGESLDAGESGAAFDVVMSGAASVAQVAALLVALRVKGETAAEVAGAARALRGAMLHLAADRPETLVDTCGTGGGAITTFNISTAAALAAAGAGVRIAKHGNRSFTSQCGSADVLEAMGVPIEASLEVMARVLTEANIVFMFAPLMHPAMRHVGPVRRELGIPTVMNIVGPLANPASAGRQVIGVSDRARVPLIAGALIELGTVHALVVHGAPGMDEISPLGLTEVTEIRDGRVSHWTIDPGDYDLAGATAEELQGGGPAQNAAIVGDVLAGRGNRATRAAVALNAAGAIYVGGLAATFGDAIEAALASLDAGRGLVVLDALRRGYSAGSTPPRQAR